MIGRDRGGALIGRSRRWPLLIPVDRELPEAYPGAEMLGSLPAYALYARDVGYHRNCCEPMAGGSTPSACNESGGRKGLRWRLFRQVHLALRRWAGVIPDQRRKAWVNALASA
jgi:hypothetical protein